MKKIILVLLIGISACYAQLTANIESRKYTVQHPYSYFPGNAQIGDNEIAIGSFITDMEGNITGDIPSYLIRDFGFSKTGIYSFYTTTNFIVVSNFGFVTYENMNTITKINKTTKVTVDKGNSNEYLSNITCYETGFSPVFLTSEGGLSDYCVYIDHKKVQSFENGVLVKAVETKAEGKRMDQFHTPDGMYYALFASQNKLTLAQINLKTGEDKYVTLSKDYSDYFGGKMQIVDDKIYLSSFYGTCDSKTDLMNYWAATKTEGILAMTINAADLKVENKTTGDIPSDFAKIITNQKGQTYIGVTDALFVKDGVYFLNYSAEGPYGIWQYRDGGIELVSYIKSDVEKGTIDGAKLFHYENKTYIVYVESVPANLGHFSISLHIAELDDHELKEIELTIKAADEVKGSFDLNYSYITSKGLIMIPGNNNYDTNHLIKIQL